MDTQDISRPRLSEEDWLAAAYEVLTESGVEAVKVMPLAKRLGVSRTSFYWHFKDREELLEAMVRRWEERNTGNLVARTEAYAESIAEAMFNLFDCWIDPGCLTHGWIWPSATGRAMTAACRNGWTWPTPAANRP